MRPFDLLSWAEEQCCQELLSNSILESEYKKKQYYWLARRIHNCAQACVQTCSQTSGFVQTSAQFSMIFNQTLDVVLSKKWV